MLDDLTSAATSSRTDLAVAADAVRALIAEGEAQLASDEHQAATNFERGRTLGRIRGLEQALTAILNAGVER